MIITKSLNKQKLISTFATLKNFSINIKWLLEGDNTDFFWNI